MRPAGAAFSSDACLTKGAAAVAGLGQEITRFTLISGSAAAGSCSCPSFRARDRCRSELEFREAKSRLRGLMEGEGGAGVDMGGGGLELKAAAAANPEAAPLFWKWWWMPVKMTTPVASGNGGVQILVLPVCCPSLSQSERILSFIFLPSPLATARCSRLAAAHIMIVATLAPPAFACCTQMTRVCAHAHALAGNGAMEIEARVVSCNPNAWAWAWPLGVCHVSLSSSSSGGGGSKCPSHKTLTLEFTICAVHDESLTMRDV